MRPIDPSKIRRILITRSDRIGDVVLSTPIFRAVKEKYPACYLAVMVIKENQALVQGNPWVDEVITYDKKNVHRRWLETILFGVELRKGKFDLVIHLHPTNRMYVISFLARIPIRVGYKRKSFFLLTHYLPERKREGKFHEAEYNFDLLNSIGILKPSVLEFYFPLHSQDRDQLISLFGSFSGRYIVFHPSASCISKRWPLDRFAVLADRLVNRYGVGAVVIGEGEGLKHAAKMASLMKETLFNFAGKLSLGMLGWLLKDAQLLVSNDSGPVHIAAALGTPVISIFGRNQPGLSVTRWRPLSENSSYLHKDVGCVVCLAHRCQINFKCLNELKLEEVMTEVEKYEPFLVSS